MSFDNNSPNVPIPLMARPLLDRHPAPWWTGHDEWTAYDASGEMVVGLSFGGFNDAAFVCKAVNTWAFAHDDEAALQMIVAYFDAQPHLKRISLSCRYFAWELLDESEPDIRGKTLFVPSEPGGDNFRGALNRSIRVYAGTQERFSRFDPFGGVLSLLDDIAVEGALIPWAWEWTRLELLHLRDEAVDGDRADGG